MAQQDSLHRDCPLCRLVAGEIKTKLYWNYGLSICVSCETCHIPMAVIKRHDVKMTQEEDEHIYTKALEYFGDNFAGLRTQARKILDHAHYHILLKGDKND